MKRTTVMLPDELKARAERRAYERGISFGQLVRESVEIALSTTDEEQRAKDPLFHDEATYDGEAPADLSEAHDEYLYGAKRKK
jgi:hypothetical protein